MSDRDYDQALTNLLPPGPAWTRQQGSPGSAVLTSDASVLSRIDAIAMRLIKEADPRTCTETFEDWLRVYGIPDECMQAVDDLTESQMRQALLLLVRRSGLTHQFYKELGAIFDIDIETDSSDPFSVDSRVDARLYGADWSHAYVIVVRTSLTTNRAYFTAISRVDERLSTWGISFIECLIRENAPAHAEVIFEYES